MPSDRSIAYLQLHLCVILWGFTAILGKLISLQTVPLVFWRVLFCCLLLPFLFPLSQFRSVPRAVLLKLLWIGGLVGLHWLCFYGSVKLANASVAVVTMACTSFFTALAEPYFLNKKMNWRELGLGAMVLPGMALVAGSLDWEMRWGFLIGVLGGLIGAIFSVLNKKIIDEHHPPALLMSFVELFAILILTGLLMPFFASAHALPNSSDMGWLLILAWLCTILPFSLSLKTMRQLSAFTLNLVLNLEPVYGILLAGVILHEHQELNLYFYVGVVIILLAVFAHPFLKKQE